MTNKPTTQNGNAHGRYAKQTAKSQVTREKIIAVAISLFRANGYANTSLSQISRQAGINPSSLYYYFSSKEDLLNSVFDQGATVPPIPLLEDLSESRGAQLYALIAYDIVHKCELPIDFNELEDIAAQNRDSFYLFFEHYRLLYRSFVTVLQRGIEEGAFIPCTPDVRTVTILSMNEGLQHHFHAKHRKRLILEASGYTVRNYTPEDIARMGALSIIPSLVKDPLALNACIDEGRNLYYQLKRRLDN